jgi:hypothetical protein
MHAQADAEKKNEAVVPATAPIAEEPEAEAAAQVIDIILGSFLYLIYQPLYRPPDFIMS